MPPNGFKVLTISEHLFEKIKLKAEKFNRTIPAEIEFCVDHCQEG